MAAPEMSPARENRLCRVGLAGKKPANYFRFKPVEVTIVAIFALYRCLSCSCEAGMERLESCVFEQRNRDPFYLYVLSYWTIHIIECGRCWPGHITAEHEPHSGRFLLTAWLAKREVFKRERNGCSHAYELAVVILRTTD